MPMVLVIKTNSLFGFELMNINTITIRTGESIPCAIISIGIIIDWRFKLP
jgi:hypothetical protein